MSFNGFTRSCAKRSGGVRSLRLIEADSILSATYDAATDSFTALTLTAGKSFADYEFIEESCSLTEICRFDNGSKSVEHRLSFALPRADAASRSAAEEIADASWTGVVAVVETMTGELLLAGYSVEFGNDKGLSVESVELSSGAKPSDRTALEIVLHSTDTSLSRLFTGTL